MSKYYTIYSGSSLNQLVTQMGIENSATTFHYDFPKNITRYDKTYKVTITNNNDPNCIKSGETLVTVPYEDECFCTCDNISLFYREMKTNFPMMFDGGKQRYEVASGNTQGCGILSANTAESDMFENQEIEVVKDGDDYHFYATVLDHPEGYTGGQRTAGVVVYFIPTSEISGDPQWDTACQQTFTCIQNSDTLNMLTCDFFSGLTFSSMPQTGSYTGMVISAFFDNVPQNPYYNGPAFIEFNVSNDKGLSLTRCGVQTYVYSGGHHSAFSLFNIPLNTLHSTILWTITANVCLDGELEVIGSDDPNYDTYDKMNIRNKMKRGYPCGKITLRTLQEGLPPCTCEEIPSAQTETHSWNSRSYYARGEITRVVPASQETCYSAMSVTEISGDCAWINPYYFQRTDW